MSSNAPERLYLHPDSKPLIDEAAGMSFHTLHNRPWVTAEVEYRRVDPPANAVDTIESLQRRLANAEVMANENQVVLGTVLAQQASAEKQAEAAEKSEHDAIVTMDSYLKRADEAEKERDRLREALAFARSCIKSGESWTDTCEQTIDAVLAETGGS